METMITQETKPFDSLADEQKAVANEVAQKYREKPAVKKPKGNMIPRKVVELPLEVKTVQELLLKLGDYSTLSEGDDISDNIASLSEILIEVGDLQRFPDEIADVFVKCFSQLSVQIPILATLLHLLNEREHDFVVKVVEKLQMHYIHSLATDQVLTSKLFLRTIACLASAGSFATEGSGGLLAILETLLVMTKSVAVSPNEPFADVVVVCSYLLATTIPWALEALTRSNSQEGSTAAAGIDFMKRLLETLQQLKAAWKCPFDLSQRQAMLARALPSHLKDTTANPSDDMEETENVVPLSIHHGVSDSYQESLQVAIHLLELAILMSSSSTTALELPEIYFMPWKILQQRKQAAEGEAYTPSYSQNVSFNATQLESDMTTLFTQQLVGATFRTNHQPVNTSGMNPHHVAAMGLSYHLGEKALANKHASFLHSRISIFTSETNDEITPCCHLSLVEKALLFAYLEDILNYFDMIINEDGTKLGSMELLMNHLTSLNRLFSINNDSQATVGKIPIEYFLVECFFHKLLSIPLNRQHYSLPMYKLLLQYCKHYPSFPPIIALAINILFLMIPCLDVMVIQQFAQWFAFHFINTSLKWPFWDFWIGECGLVATTEGEQEEEGGATVNGDLESQITGDNYLQIYFIRCFVQRCALMVSDEKLGLVIPKEFQGFLIGNHGELVPKHFLAANNEEMTTENSNNNNGGVVDPEIKQQLKELFQQRRRATDVIAFIETIPAFVQEESRQTLIELLLEVIVSIVKESETLTSLFGLVEIYHDALQVIIESDEHHLIAARTLFHLCVNHKEMLYTVCEEMIRRNQLSAVAVTQVLLDSQFYATVVKDPFVLRMLQLVSDRSVDFVRAALLHRENLGAASPLVLDETADLTPVDYETFEQSVAHLLQKPEEEQDEAEEEAENGDRRSRKRGYDDRDDRMDDNEDNDPRSSPAYQREEQLFIANEAVKRAVRSARLIYRMIVEACFAAWSSTSANHGVDPVLLQPVLIALLAQTWRGFFGFQLQISSQYQRKIVLTEALTSEMLVVLQQQVPAFYENWRAYLV